MAENEAAAFMVSARPFIPQALATAVGVQEDQATAAQGQQTEVPIADAEEVCQYLQHD